MTRSQIVLIIFAGVVIALAAGSLLGAVLGERSSRR